jgi:VWFA-related protein
MAALAMCSLGTAAQQQPSFSASTNLVVVPAIVFDKKGVPVAGLEAGAFQLFEDGRAVPIEVFLPPGPQGLGVDGRFIVLVLDNLRTPAEIGWRVQDIARRFASRMGPSDVVSVITVDGGRAATGVTQAEVKAAIDRFRPSFGETIRSDAETAAHGLRIIGDLTRQLVKVPHRRKVMVFIGSASMFSPNEESAFADRGPEFSPDWLDAIREAGRNNVSVYVIDPQSAPGRSNDDAGCFAGETGGYTSANTANYNAVVERIWRESGSYYLLGYRAPINDHRLHKIELKVSMPGVVVKSRRARG